MYNITKLILLIFIAEFGIHQVNTSYTDNIEEDAVLKYLCKLDIMSFCQTQTENNKTKITDWFYNKKNGSFPYMSELKELVKDITDNENTIKNGIKKYESSVSLRNFLISWRNGFTHSFANRTNIYNFTFATLEEYLQFSDMDKKILGALMKPPITDLVTIHEGLNLYIYIQAEFEFIYDLLKILNRQKYSSMEAEISSYFGVILNRCDIILKNKYTNFKKLYEEYYRKMDKEDFNALKKIEEKYRNNEFTDSGIMELFTKIKLSNIEPFHGGINLYLERNIIYEIAEKLRKLYGNKNEVIKNLQNIATGHDKSNTTISDVLKALNLSKHFIDHACIALHMLGRQLFIELLNNIFEEKIESIPNNLSTKIKKQESMKPNELKTISNHIKPIKLKPETLTIIYEGFLAEQKNIKKLTAFLQRFDPDGEAHKGSIPLVLHEALHNKDDDKRYIIIKTNVDLGYLSKYVIDKALKSYFSIYNSTKNYENQFVFALFS